MEFGNLLDKVDIPAPIPRWPRFKKTKKQKCNSFLGFIQKLTDY